RLVRVTSQATDGVRILVAWALFHAAFYAILLPTPGHGGRYQPLTPLLFAACLPLGAALVLAELVRGFGLGARLRFGVVAAASVIPWVVLAAPTAGALREANALAVAHIRGTEIAVGRYI